MSEEKRSTVADVPQTLMDLVRQRAAESPLLPRIQRIVDTLRRMEVGLGMMPHWDAIVARRLESIERALVSVDHDVVHREVVIEMVRESAKLLAQDRRKPKKLRTPDEEPITAEDMADEMIAHDGPRPLYPWLARLAVLRPQLVAAIESASHKGSDSEDSMRALCAALGLDLPTAGAARAHRTRTKRHITK